MLQFNRNHYGLYRNWLFGFAAIADGLVRVASFGVLRSDFMMFMTRQQARRAIKKLKTTTHTLDKHTMPPLK